MAAAKQLLRPSPCASAHPSPIRSPHGRLGPPRAKLALPGNSARSPRPCGLSGRRLRAALPRASASGGGAAVSGDGEDGVSLGTMKLPPDTDLARFELLLFQWANSLCQGATLPLPVPLKVDRVEGGARLGFVKMGDAGVDVPVHIDCLVFPADGAGSGPMFRAIRNGPLKDQVAPGEQRIMRSLLQALQTSVEIATRV
ncbi:hypothetical protein Taro_039020 [Colocasia esculenta]|uniref:DUF7148 domain-containing protein n=1 Tax=Colocasia esculenta TaxID=4460 RepID=A0A843WUF2_COLES|nr:hypothetical protein [Colocasia esculenta]